MANRFICDHIWPRLQLETSDLIVFYASAVYGNFPLAQFDFYAPDGITLPRVVCARG